MIKRNPNKFILLSGTGVKPTVPVPANLLPLDKDWKSTDIMMGQSAYNVTDKKWYVRDSSGIRESIDEIFSGVFEYINGLVAGINTNISGTANKIAKFSTSGVVDSIISELNNPNRIDIGGDLKVFGTIYATGNVIAYSEGSSGGVPDDPLTYHVSQIASYNNLGHVRIGENINIDEYGRINFNSNINSLINYYTKTESDLRFAPYGVYIPLDQKGTAGGVATLDSSGYVPLTQLNINAITSGCVKYQTESTHPDQTIWGNVIIRGKIYATDNIIAYYQGADGAPDTTPLDLHAATIASASVLGHVMIGDNINIDQYGKISFNSNISSLSNYYTKNESDTRFAPYGVYIPLSQKGVANGVASLDSSGFVPISQLNVSSIIAGCVKYQTETTHPDQTIWGNVIIRGKIYATDNIIAYYDGADGTPDTTPLDIHAATIASASVLGHVKIGSGVSIALDGTISVASGAGMVYPSAGIAVSTGSSWSTSITDNSANWNTAYNWGNHASMGYFIGTSSTIRTLLSSSATGLTYTNSTGVFSLTSGYVIPTTTQESNWNAAYSWGNHTSANYHTGSGTSGYIPKFTGAYTLGNSPIYTDGTNVGIGTTNPTYRLQVAGDIGTDGLNQFYARYTSGTENYKGSFNWYGLQLGNNGENYIVAGRTVVGGKLNFVVNNTTDFPTVNGTIAMTIDAAAKVGIGTTSPTYNLDVNGDARVSVLRFNSSSSSYITAGASQLRFYYDAYLYNALTFTDGSWNPSSGFINGAPLILNGSNSGKVGIGMTPTTYKLEVNGDVYATNGWLRTYGSTGLYNEQYGGGIYMTDSTYVRVYNNKKLYVGNDIVSTGEITAYYSSDYRLKREIKDFTGLELIEKLSPKTYYWNDIAKGLNPLKSDSIQYGLIAQEVEEVMPELVHKIYGKYKSLDYISIIPILIQAVKELKSEIKTLKNG